MAVERLLTGWVRRAERPEPAPARASRPCGGCGAQRAGKAQLGTLGAASGSAWWLRWGHPPAPGHGQQRASLGKAVAVLVLVLEGLGGDAQAVPPSCGCATQLWLCQARESLCAEPISWLGAAPEGWSCCCAGMWCWAEHRAPAPPVPGQAARAAGAFSGLSGRAAVRDGGEREGRLTLTLKGFLADTGTRSGSCRWNLAREVLVFNEG